MLKRKCRLSCDQFCHIIRYNVFTKERKVGNTVKKGLTELVFILDRSGSMSGLEDDTIGGFNGMLDKQKRQEGEANVTTVLFDDRYDVIHDRFPIQAVRPLTREEYYVRGCTALLDAVGKTIHKMGTIQKYLPEEMRAEKVIFTITTDGKENASREYGYDQIRRMIERQKESYGWEFLFLGANIDAIAEAGKLGIAAERAVRYENDSAGVQENYDALELAIGEMRSAPSMSSVGAGWKEGIGNYFRKKNGK